MQGLFSDGIRVFLLFLFLFCWLTDLFHLPVGGTCRRTADSFGHGDALNKSFMELFREEVRLSVWLLIFWSGCVYVCMFANYMDVCASVHVVPFFFVCMCLT